ncbi:kinase-like protein [Hypoxylon crocopeplum]|nr:kinase-like protein [Hypoxylon crocopeplum]
MATLRVPVSDDLEVEQKAVEDAELMQTSIEKECTNTGKLRPPYTLLELIGKGSFGRVYKATSTKSVQLVSVKIISIEEGDSLNPRMADTFTDILKEVNTLKLLNNSGAKNINMIIDTILVGQSIWMVTEYCAGGSVATLMRPTGGLPEKWIIPILREVAEAIFWVHQHGVIHRDIKCANVLITQVGEVQLCDFGVAGIMETKFDKRSTVTGTLHWMAPELFDSNVSYGVEVDVWAFGSMAYEVASGSPPNATARIDVSQFGSYLNQHCPRLEGDQYSSQLKDIVACCMVEDPAQRPPIEQVQRHPYIFNTASDYPTASLSQLVNTYKLWESHGGHRRSLFSVGGAQGPTKDNSSILDHMWNFSTINNSDHLTFDDRDAQAVYDAHAPRIEVPTQPFQPRRRRPPNIKALRVPLERVFDPNTISNYEDNTRDFYGRIVAPATSDLPLRENSKHQTVRESLIDLDASLNGNDLSQFVDIETIKPGVRPFSGDTADSDRRRTQDWIFPMTTPTSDPDVPYSQPHNYEAHSTRVYHPSDLVTNQPPGQVTPSTPFKRASTFSLIDLDAALESDTADVDRPLTANSDTASSTSDIGGTPFDLEQHVSEAPLLPTNEEDSYISDDIDLNSPPETQHDDSHDTLIISSGNRPVLGAAPELSYSNGSSLPSLPTMPLPPSANVIQGIGSTEELKDEFRRMILSLNEHLRFTADVLGLPSQPPERP